MSSFRWVICVDVEAEDMVGSYRKLYAEMKKVDRREFSWESTNEVYDPLGKPLDEATISTARMIVIDENVSENDEREE